MSLLVVATNFRTLLSHCCNLLVHMFGTFQPSDWFSAMLICLELKAKNLSGKQEDRHFTILIFIPYLSLYLSLHNKRIVRCYVSEGL
jgi:hypothetical protein